MEDTQRITRREAAEILGVTVQTVSNLVDRGALSVEKSGKWWYFSRAEVESLIPKSDGLRDRERAIAEVERELDSELLARTGVMDVRRSRKEFIEALGTGSVWPRYKELVTALYRALERTGMYGDFLTARDKAALEAVLDLAPLAEIAESVGLTPERVRQIFELALRRIVHFTTKVAPEVLSLRQKVKGLEDENALLREQLKEAMRQNELALNCEARKIRIEDLELSVRAVNCLLAADIKTLGDLTRISRRELSRFRNIGIKTYGEIADILTHYGLRFRGDEA